MRQNTRENPYGGRDYNSPSNMTRMGNSLRFTASASAPQSEADGVSTQDWKSVHVIFYGGTTVTDLVAVFRPWRWYAKQLDSVPGAGTAHVGKWIPDFEVTAALDPARISGTISSHYVWDTRDAEKMYWQLLGVYNSAGEAGTMPAYVSAQVFGYAQQNDTVAVAVCSPVSGTEIVDINAPGTWRPSMASVKATHWSPNNGNVTFATAVTLTAAAWPFVVDDANCTILGLIVRKASGVVREYVNGMEGVSLSATAGVVTIAGAGAAPFAVGDLDYSLYVIEEEKAYSEASNSYRTEEISPLNGEYTQPEYAINDVAVSTAATGYFPSTDGIIIDDYKDICFEVYLVGGQDVNGDRVVDVKFQGSNDVVVGAARQWVDLAVGYSLNTDSTQTTWTGTGLTATVDCVDFDNWVQKRIRGYYEWDAAPDVEPGAIVVTYRRKAL